MDTVLSSILGPVCERLLDAAMNLFTSEADVKEIQKLHFTVGVVRGVLEDAETQVAHPAVGGLKELKLLLLDAEDVLDEIATDEALRRRNEESDVQGTRSVAWRAFKRLETTLSSFIPVGGTSSTRAIALQIKDINKRFDDITRVIDGLGLVRHELGENRSSTAVRPEWRETCSVLRRDSRIIGRDEDMSRMRNLLLDATCGEGGVHVICVVGMGGIGKTTLMQHVFNDPEVRKHFQFTKWVCVSNDFDVRRIAREIKGKEEGNSPSSLEAALVDLKDSIEGKRFFLVLDDVWEENSSKWDKLYAPLSYGAEGSKIVVTTRSKTVSNITKGTQIILKDLSNDDLWSIFQKYAFEGHDQKKNMQLISVGKQIVEKLKGSPLAAKIIGGLLNSNVDDRYWTKIKESEALLEQSRGVEGNDILRVLKLSYDHLPGHLKQCFSYCSLFPEDHQFTKDEVVQLWMAQQFIVDNSIEGANVESVGGECFDYLVHVSLFEKQESYDGVQYYVMHDLIHELADSVSKDDCLRLMKDPHPEAVRTGTIRHISVINTDLAKLIRVLSENYEKLRTLLFTYDSGRSFSCDDLNLLFTKLQRLRILGLKGCWIPELSESISNLKHLRYLDVSYNDFQSFPESLCDLYNLQKLNLESCNIKKLPESIGKLKHLRYLDLSNNYGIIKLPNSLCNLCNLQMLNLCCCNLTKLPKSINNLKHLHNLNLYGNREIKKLPKSLCDLRNLQVLDIRGCPIHALPRNMSALINKLILHELRLDCGRGSGGQPILKELQNMNMLRQLDIHHLEGVDSKEEAEVARLHEKSDLQELKMRWSCDRDEVEINPELEGEVLECLRPPSSIRELTIENYGGIRSPSWMGDPSWVCPSNSLETLEIEGCMNWEILPPLGRLPCLKTLKIKKMNHVRRLPAGDDQYSMDGTAAFFPSLEELEFEDMEEWEEWEVPSPLLQSSLFLPHLQKLRIHNCPKLRQLPPLPPSLERLEIEKVGLTVFSPLPSSLQELIIGYNNNLDTDSLSAWLRSPTSPRSLTIVECSNIVSLPSTEAPSHMTMTVATLEICSLSALKSLGGFIHPHNSLEKLTIDDCPELADLTGSESSTTSQCAAGGDVASTSIKHLVISRSTPRAMHQKLSPTDGFRGRRRR